MTGALSGKIALVTGASRGIGRGIAEALADEGAHVVGVATDAGRMDDVAAGIAERGGRFTRLACDITSEADVDRLHEDVATRVGEVDVLVNNAGIAWERAFVDLTVDEFRRVFDVNVTGMFLVTRTFGRGMIERGSGRVINIGSVDAVVGTPNLVHYCASKGAVVQLTRALATEWARYNITVNCVCPGYVETDINTRTLADPVIRDKIIRRIPLHRFGTVSEIAAWVVLLAGEQAGYSTGQVLLVDGGESAR